MYNITGVELRMTFNISKNIKAMWYSTSNLKLLCKGWIIHSNLTFSEDKVNLRNPTSDQFVCLRVVQGDIVQAETDVVVNSLGK